MINKVLSFRCSIRAYRFCNKIKKPNEEEQLAQKPIDAYEKSFGQLASLIGSQSSTYFSSHVIYENKFEMQDLAKRMKIGIYYSGFWLAITAVTVSTVNPWFGLIPFWFCLNSGATSVAGRRYMRHLVKAIRITEDLQTCVIEVANGNLIRAKISENDVLKLIDVVPNVKTEPELTKTYQDKNYIIEFKATDYETNVEHNKLRMLISVDQVHIENVQLLKDVIEGQDISQWQFKEPVDFTVKVPIADPELRAKVEAFEKELLKEEGKSSEKKNK